MAHYGLSQHISVLVPICQCPDRRIWARLALLSSLCKCTQILVSFRPDIKLPSRSGHGSTYINSTDTSWIPTRCSLSNPSHSGCPPIVIPVPKLVSNLLALSWVSKAASPVLALTSRTNSLARNSLTRSPCLQEKNLMNYSRRSPQLRILP
jgi:hypothetical protein